MIMSREGVALIIDDESELCLLLKKYLSRKFKKVEIATTLKEGISMAKQLSPDVVFLDNNLPDGHGIDYIKLFRLNAKKIILISAMTNLADLALKLGANYFIAKPISFKSIDDAINL